MIFHFRNKFPQLDGWWEKYKPLAKRVEAAAKTVLLEEGATSRHYIFIESGCVRAYFNNNGKECTVQFFFEGQGLTSFDSFVNNVPSQFTIETIETSVVYMLAKRYVVRMIDEMRGEPEFVSMLFQLSAQRQVYYINEFLSLIRDTPEQRYQNLLTERPHIVRRVPQHYIAAYLGVSAVHLSRIKAKLAKGKDHF